MDLKHSRITHYAARIIGALIVLAASGGLGQPPRASADEQHPFQIYLPVVGIERPSIFGLNVSHFTPERGIDDIASSGTNWVRGSSLLWRDIEPVEGREYSWDAPRVQALEQEMINASQRNLSFILIVHGSPRWAVKPYTSDCAPIHPTKYGRFATFMKAAVARYSQPPYNVKFWEIGNEPDAYVFPTDSGYGCWGLRNDQYYGGRAYGAMLNVVYPAIKAAAPDVTVLNGGLLLAQPYDAATGGMARFLEGVFVAGAGGSFDMLSFHSYSYYDGTVDGTRGATDWKVAFLREMMRSYNIPEKPMIDTEAALLCSALTERCRIAQANAIGRYYIRAINDRLVGHLWYIYDSDSFNNSALVDPNDVSSWRATNLAYRQAASLLGDAALVGTLQNQAAGVEGYRFAKSGQSITAFWSDQPQPVILPIAAGTSVTCADRDGKQLDCAASNGLLTLTAQPGPTYVVEKP